MTGTYQPTDENGAADGEAMTVSFRVFVRGIVLDAGADSVQISLNEDISSQTIGYKLIDGTGETGKLLNRRRLHGVLRILRSQRSTRMEI